MGLEREGGTVLSHAESFYLIMSESFLKEKEGKVTANLELMLPTVHQLLSIIQRI